MAVDPSAACATHGGQPGLVDCAQCGRPACAYCLQEGSGDLCAACAEREEGGGVIAFERRDLGFLARLFRTMRDVLARPGATFGRLRPGGVGASLLYVALVYALTSLGMLGVLVPLFALSAAGWQTPLDALGMGGMMFLVAIACGGPPTQALLGIAFALLMGGLYHAAAKAAGGRASFETSVRVAAYGLTIVLLWAPLTVAVVVPTMGLVVLCVVLVIQLLFLGNAFTAAAHGPHELDDAPARLAGWTVPIALLVVLALAVGVSFWVVESTEPSRAPDVYEPASGPVDYR